MSVRYELNAEEAERFAEAVKNGFAFLLDSELFNLRALRGLVMDPSALAGLDAKSVEHRELMAKSIDLRIEAVEGVIRGRA